MLRGGEDEACVLDAHYLVGRRVEDKQGLVQFADPLPQALLPDIVQEAAADSKRATGKRNFDLSGGADVCCSIVLEQPDDMRGIGSRIDGHHRSDFLQITGSRKHSRATEAVPYQDCGCAPASAKRGSGG